MIKMKNVDIYDLVDKKLCKFTQRRIEYSFYFSYLQIYTYMMAQLISFNVIV